MPVTASRLSPRSAPTKSATNALAGLPSSSAGVANCSTCPPCAHHRDPVAEPHRLLDVVGDEDDRLADGLLQAQELRLQPLAHDRVDGGERLVHQQHRRVGGQRPGDPGPLPLPAGELGG